MADITQRDVMLLFTMGLAVVSMSFVFPALGLADESVDANEIPEFSIDSDRFDFAGEFPSAPGSPNTGELVWLDARDEQLNQVWLRGDTSGGVEMVLLPPADSSDTLDVRINEWSGGATVYEEDVQFSNEGEEHIRINETLGYEMRFEATEIDRSNDNYRVEYEVISQTVDGGWISNIPVIGSAVSVASATAAVLSWFVEIAVWSITYIFDIIANTAGMMADVAGYLVGLLSWLTTTYGSIISSAQSWVAVFVALPGILLSAVLAKMVVIAIGLLPTT